MSTAWGIDLGTTNSCITRLEGGVPVPVELQAGAILPSVVLYEGERVVVGREAYNLAAAHPERCVRSVKRRMGRGPAYTVDGREISPEEVSAEILGALKRGAEQATGLDVQDVVITVPAYFDDAQRRATLRAGEQAGLNVLRLLNEPTSASLVYEQTGATQEASNEPEIVMIYDLGGGTFDVSVLEVVDGVREVRATAGNSQLGGDDFDELLFRRFADHLKHERGADDASDPRACARLRDLAERTKIALSSELEHTASAEFVATDASGAPVHFEQTVTRRELETQLRPLLETTLELARRALDDARLSGQQLDRICLVGGSTRIPLVAALLEEAFGVDVHQEVDPDLAVGLGASVQAGLLRGESVERILVDVAAHSLGILVVGDHDHPGHDPDTFAPVLRRNTVLPAERAQEFYTMVDDQELLKVQVFQGESRRASENRPVGTFNVPLEPRPSHSPVAVTFAYDLDGVIRVTVEQPGTSVRKTARLQVADAAPTEAADTPVLRRARAMLQSLGEAAQQTMQTAISSYEGATTDGAREQAEEALLDLLVDLDEDDEG